jgi:hypothetical protein
LAIDIGLYWSIEEAFGDLGNKAIILELKLGKIQLEVKNYNTTLMTSSWIKSQICRKKISSKTIRSRCIIFV